MKICLAQLNYTIGNFEENTSKMSLVIQEAKKENADLVVFSELAVCGYPPEDLLDYPHFVERCEQSLEAVAESCQGIAAIVGGVMTNRKEGRGLHNVACFMQNGRIENVVKKTLLPTYDIFNEARYFEPNTDFSIIEYKGVKLGIAICEDLWDKYNDFEYKQSPMAHLALAGAQLIIHPAASPYDHNKSQLRNTVFDGNNARFHLPLLYVNQVGAHTELIFDGDSKAFNAKGEEVYRAPKFKEHVGYVHFNQNDISGEALPADELDDSADMHDALVFGIRDYFSKMGFKKAILGSSGGIDSSIVQTLASKALGPENVWAILMPSEFSSEGSIADARKLCENLGNEYSIIPIKGVYDAYLDALQTDFKGKAFDLAEENLQARARGMMLMALSNKHGHILLNTSNKSEVAVGYSTLYGDMCGSLSPLGDVYKMKVYALAEYINAEKEIIPEVIVKKAPSAELRPGQKDSDSLPQYPLLDEILYHYIEQRRGRTEIKSLNYESQVVDKVVDLVNRAEFKRFQGPPILRVTRKAFGAGRRIPLVAKYG